LNLYDLLKILKHRISKVRKVRKITLPRIFGTRLNLYYFVMLFGAVAIFQFSFYMTAGTVVKRLIEGTYRNQPPSLMLQAANLMSEVPEIENMSLAYGDAGMFAYYTNVRFLDVVGLNNNQIALNGAEKGADWVIDYILNQKPDVIGMYVYPDGQIFNAGHGVIGAHYSDLYRDERFQENYAENNLEIFIGWTHIRWFVHKDSPYLIPFFETMQPMMTREPSPVIP
jgi:hypothetical protein